MRGASLVRRDSPGRSLLRVGPHLSPPALALEKSKLWENGKHNAVGARTVTKVDTRGRVYLPGALRKAAGLGINTVVEIETRGGQVILTKQHAAVATSFRDSITEKAPGADGDAMLARFLAKEATEELQAIGGR